jgi:IS30 family transposase
MFASPDKPMANDHARGKVTRRVQHGFVDQDEVTKAFAKVPKMMRRSLAYNQGKEMARYKEPTSRLGMPVYFCDPHSPWQRHSNESLNGHVRQYLPKGIRPVDLQPARSRQDPPQPQHQIARRPRLPSTRENLDG